ncbi:MAG: geranylgeranylglyceryl/heptaprenylglyceryl phosphate synthase [Candidatus Hodarchaeaceae archaeon]|nr:geranylgeranylglyceryl/heptaprenylglyceryl phosphate synthase [Candidatus Hodarchaeaceae archaeon]
MRVEKHLSRVIDRDGAAHLTLIDPARQRPEIAGQIASDAATAGSDGIMVGGSTRAGGRPLDQTVRAVKEATSLPVILFPASEVDISGHADAIFFMSMLNSADPYFITGAQRLGAPLVKRFGLEALPMAYLVVEPGGAAGRVGRARLIPRDEPELAVAYALAAQYFGMRFVYLEAGSGAKMPVTVEMVKAVRKAIDVTLIVGGGIKTPKAAAERVKAGANIIVTGTLVERSANRVAKIREIVEAIKSSGGAWRTRCRRSP